MTPQTFDFFSKFLYEKSGLSLQKEKQYLLENRLGSVLKQHNIGSYEMLASQVKSSPNGNVALDVVESMSVTETSFFRDRTPFDLFQNTMLPEILANRPASQPIRIWSAAASSGQEAYTLAMLCKENASLLGGRRVEIIATDISKNILEKAKAGLYSQFEVQRGLPTNFLLSYFEQAGEMWGIVPEIKSMVNFRQFNLMDSFSGFPKFDIIFCRNVLIYFDVETKSSIFKKLHATMANDGFLVLGGAETTIGLSDEYASDGRHRVLFRSRQFKAQEKQAMSA